MKRSQLEELAQMLREGQTPPGVRILKRNPVRCVAHKQNIVLKVFLRASRTATREARALAKASARGIPVPQLLDAGPTWLATRWIEARPATRSDLDALLRLVDHMHATGMLHGDLHLGNFLIRDAEPVLLDTQRSRFWPHLPGVLRRWELGRLAYSLGSPPPPELAAVSFWRRRRQRQHWRSRTRRCVKESSAFTRFEAGAGRGFRRRDQDADALRTALVTLDGADVIWPRPGGHLYRTGGWIVKQHASTRAARRAWIAGHGLEVRGIHTARALAWAGPWLIMEDARGTVVEWSQREFSRAPAEQQLQMMTTLSDLLSDLHRRGIYHADTKACNVCWTPKHPARLLDYEKVRFDGRISLRRRTKNLAQLNAALPDVVPGPLREQGLRRYVERCGFTGDVARLRREIIRLSLRRDHRWHGC